MGRFSKENFDFEYRLARLTASAERAQTADAGYLGLGRHFDGSGGPSNAKMAKRSSTIEKRKISFLNKLNSKNRLGPCNRDGSFCAF